MDADRTVLKTVDEYIAGFPPEVQEVLQQVRQTIRAAAPDAQETIKYGMPTYTLKGNLIYFAGYAKHVSVYPVPAGTEEFQRKLAGYRAFKSTARFRLGQPVPYDLIREMVQFRVAENLKRGDTKGRY